MIPVHIVVDAPAQCVDDVSLAVEIASMGVKVQDAGDAPEARVFHIRVRELGPGRLQVGLAVRDKDGPASARVELVPTCELARRTAALFVVFAVEDDDSPSHAATPAKTASDLPPAIAQSDVAISDAPPLSAPPLAPRAPDVAVTIGALGSIGAMGASIVGGRGLAAFRISKSTYFGGAIFAGEEKHYGASATLAQASSGPVGRGSLVVGWGAPFDDDDLLGLVIEGGVQIGEQSGTKTTGTPQSGNAPGILLFAPCEGSPTCWADASTSRFTNRYTAAFAGASLVLHAPSALRIPRTLPLDVRPMLAFSFLGVSTDYGGGYDYAGLELGASWSGPSGR
jgi:hypothetical protein